ncbi:MAG: energy transducer TonB [Desulfobacteraceae bacterium]
MYCKTWKIYHWLGVSLVLHASIILPLVVIGVHEPKKQTHNKLLIELFGMISNRQQEERQGDGATQKKQTLIQRPVLPKQVEKKNELKKDTIHEKKIIQPKPVVEQQVKKIEHEPVPDKNSQKEEDNTVREEKSNDIQKPVESMELMQGSSVLVSGENGKGIGQKALSVRDGGLRKDKTVEYLARLSKTLQKNLVYPKEARKNGIEGVSTVAFTITESGFIKEGSLRVHKSSGYSFLDNNALQSARESAPFEWPPKELNVTISIVFAFGVR